MSYGSLWAPVHASSALTLQEQGRRNEQVLWHIGSPPGTESFDADKATASSPAVRVPR